MVMIAVVDRGVGRQDITMTGSHLLCVSRSLGIIISLAGTPVGEWALAAQARIDVYERTVNCGGEPTEISVSPAGDRFAVRFSTGETRLFDLDGKPLPIPISLSSLMKWSWTESGDGVVQVELPAIGDDTASRRRSRPGHAHLYAEGWRLHPDEHRVEHRGRGISIGHFGSRTGLLDRPLAIAALDDLVYIADTGNHRVQVFSADGEFRYKFGIHALVPRAGEGYFHYPTCIAVTPGGGRLLVGETIEGRIQIFRARRPDDPPPAPISERIELPAHYGEHWALSGKWLLISEPDGERVELYSVRDGSDPIRVAVVGDRTGSRLGEFRNPGPIVFLPGAVPPRAVVLDRGNQRIVQMEIVPVSGDELGFDPMRLRLISATRLARPTTGIAVDSGGQLYGTHGEVVTQLGPWGEEDPAPHWPSPEAGELRCAAERFWKFDPALPAIHSAAGPAGPWSTWQLDGIYPESLAALADGTLVVTDGVGHRVVLFAPDGTMLRSIGGPGVGPVEFHHPRAISVDEDDRIWVLDYGNHRGQVIDREGNFLWAFGSRSYTEPIRAALVGKGRAE